MKFADNVQERSLTVGAGPFKLQGSTLGYRRFEDTDEIDVGDSGILFGIRDEAGPDWMVCSGTLLPEDWMTVDTVYSSSNGGQVVPFGLGVKLVYSTIPAVVFAQVLQGVVVGYPPANLTIPTITGAAVVGQTLTSSNGTWTGSPTTFTRQWYRNGVEISGATAPTYLLVTADLGAVITVATVAENATGDSIAIFSLPTSAVTDTGAAGTLQLSASTYSVSEGAGTIIIPVTRTGGSTGAASVSYATANGTATAGSDFTSTSGTLNWADGDVGMKNIVVPITDDATVESSETFTVTLSGATGATLGTPSTATVTINDNDAADTRPRYGNGVANPTADAAIFATIFAAMSVLPGSANGARAGSVQTIADATLWPWVAFLSAAGSGGANMTDDSGFKGGWSGALKPGIGTVADDTSPISQFSLWTNPNTGDSWTFIRGVGHASGAHYTLS